MKYYEIDNNTLNNIKLIKFEKTQESEVHPIEIDGKLKVIKIFKNNTNLENKLKKIELMNTRLSNIDQIVTADYIATNNNKIIGYIMPYIKADNFSSPRGTSKKKIISVLKQLAELLKLLHTQNIICADFQCNILLDKNEKVFLIDHDNFGVDNYPIDLKNIYLKEYESHIKTIDIKFDNYLMNLYTIATIKHIVTYAIYHQYQINTDEFNFRDKEIKNIFKNTIFLGDSYNEELIIDKISTEKDLKKIKCKLF